MAIRHRAGDLKPEVEVVLARDHDADLGRLIDASAQLVEATGELVKTLTQAKEADRDG